MSYRGKEKPSTFACHHNAYTCRNCELMVKQWEKDNREPDNTFDNPKVDAETPKQK